LRRIVYESDALAPILVAYDLLSPIRHSFTPEDTLDAVMKAFGEMNVDELPVVQSTTDPKLIGTVTKRDVIEMYNREILKRDTVRSISSYISSADRFKEVEVVDGQFLSEMEVPGSFVGRTLKELNLRGLWGIEVILIKPADGKSLQTPRPDYKFQFGDSIVVLGNRQNLEKIKHG